VRFGDVTIPADWKMGLQDARNRFRLDVLPLEDPQLGAGQAGLVLPPVDFAHRPAAVGAGLLVKPPAQNRQDEALFGRGLNLLQTRLTAIGLRRPPRTVTEMQSRLAEGGSQGSVARG